MPYSKPGMSYQWRLFTVFLSMCFLLIICFIGFQFFREKRYRADVLNAELQIFNTQILDRLEEGRNLKSWLDTAAAPFDDLKVTIFSPDGETVFDNTLDVLPKGIQLQRRELKKAKAEGRSYTLRLDKAANSQVYFYSVLNDDNYIIRTGAPYNSVSVTDVLKTDQTFLWFMLAVSFVIGWIGYYTSRNIGETISQLSEFAERAEKGEDVRLSSRSSFPRDELGKIAANIVSLYTKMLQATEERDKQQLMLIQEEEEKQKIKRDLTHNINHELKTPVASVLGCAETLYDHPELPEAKRQDFLERIITNAKRLSALLRDVSTINRLDEASNLIQKEPVDLSKVIEEVCRDATPRAQKVGMTVINKINPGLRIMGNIPLLESIFRNLVENAIAYSGGTRVTVEMLENDNRHFTLAVYDDGTGIPEVHFPKIFDRFYRLDKGRSRKAGGTGLGLAIVRNAVIHHGGEITIANLPEGGLEFSITFPHPPEATA